jgi:multiple sugar transport system permease protein
MKDSALLGLRARRILAYAVLVVFALVCVLPVWVLLVNATRSGPEINLGFSLIPGSHLKENTTMLEGTGLNLRKGLFNSLFVSLSATALSIYCSALAAFGLSMYRFRTRRFIFGLVVGLMAIPPQIGFIGFYRYMLDVGGLNSYLPLILPAAAAPVTVFFLIQYMRSILHDDLLDAARIDGCKEFDIFNRIILAVCSPGLATMAIFTFVASWNNFFMPFLLLNKEEMYTLPMQVQFFGFSGGGGLTYLGIAITIVPLLVFYGLVSKYILAGVTMGSIKE